MKQVIVFPRGQLDPKDKERMSKAGIVAVDADVCNGRCYCGQRGIEIYGRIVPENGTP